MDISAHRRTILKGDVDYCLDAGLDAGYVPRVPPEGVLSVPERGKGSLDSWLWGGTVVEHGGREI